MRARAWPFACLLILAVLPVAAADMGMVVPGDISVYEPGQKAIIAWDGENEVLILSTNVWASENTWALELLPLPTQPASPEAGSFSSFENIQSMLFDFTRDAYFTYGLGEPAGAPLEVLFQENIGAHHITIVNVSSASQLINFAENLLEENGLTQEVSWGALESLAAVYLQRGMNYWLLDLIDLSDYLMSREPIIYSFKSDYLYFPLEISSLASGPTDITLFTITNNKLDASSVATTGFSIASFPAGGENVQIEFGVSENELQQISPKVAELFEGKVWLTALTYAGSLENLKGDIMFSAAAPPAGEAEQPTRAADQLVAAAWAAAFVALLLAIFAIIYKTSPYYKTSRHE